MFINYYSRLSARGLRIELRGDGGKVVLREPVFKQARRKAHKTPKGQADDRAVAIKGMPAPRSFGVIGEYTYKNTHASN